MAESSSVSFDVSIIDPADPADAVYWGWEIDVFIDKDVFDEAGSMVLTGPPFSGTIDLVFDEVSNGQINFTPTDADFERFMVTGYPSLAELNDALTSDAWRVAVNGGSVSGSMSFRLLTLSSSHFLRVPQIMWPATGSMIADRTPTAYWDEHGLSAIGSDADRLCVTLIPENAEEIGVEYMAEADAKPWPTDMTAPDPLPNDKYLLDVAYGRFISQYQDVNTTGDLNWTENPLALLADSIDLVQFEVIPEPASILLLGLGGALLLKRARNAVQMRAKCRRLDFAAICQSTSDAQP